MLCNRPGYLHGPEFNPLTGQGLLTDGATGLRCVAWVSCQNRINEQKRLRPIQAMLRKIAKVSG